MIRFKNIHCDYCQKALSGQFLMIRDWKFCMSHAQLPNCFACGFLVDAPRSDDYIQCETCSQRGIYDKRQGKPYFEDIIEWLKHENISFGDFPLSFKFGDLHELAQLSNGQDILGACFRENTYIEGQSRPQVKIKGVVVLEGLPPELFAVTCVHELAHVWFGIKKIKSQPLWLEEGFCELWAYRFSLWKGTKEYKWRAETIMQSDDPVYGVGFQRMYSYTKKNSFGTLLDALINRKPIQIKL